jgi:hypothetical protein
MTGRIIPLQGDHHEKVQSLLPWYMAGKLDETERADVRAHLGVCPECQADLRAEQRLAEAMGSLAGAPTDLPDVEQGWAAMRRAIEAQAQPRASTGRVAAALQGWRRALRGSWGQPWIGWAVAAQSALLAACAALLLHGLGQPVRYVALGGAPSAGGGNLVLMFRPETSESALRQILRASRVRLVDGPTAAGAYVGRADPAERAKALAALRARPELTLAEPVDAAGRD